MDEDYYEKMLEDLLTRVRVPEEHVSALEAKIQEKEREEDAT